MEHKVFGQLKADLKKCETVDLQFTAEETMYTRRWTPKERLILLGGGHIAQPLCKIGAMLDFAVTVVDDRPSFANHLRFPDAEEVICDDFQSAIESLHIRAEDFVCTITRGHSHDADCLRSILPGIMPKYLGMIGSRRRVSGLMELLKEEGFDTAKLEKICAPIGLDINAQTTTEIAVAITAQLVEYRRKGWDKHSVGEVLPQSNVDMPLIETLAEPKEPLVMALVVETKGSTPVKAGAMMAVGVLGRVEGTIGGGCGEAEITQVARKMVGTREKKIVSVNMTNEVAEEEGMVCGGIMKVLLEPVE